MSVTTPEMITLALVLLLEATYEMNVSITTKRVSAFNFSFVVLVLNGQIFVNSSCFINTAGSSNQNLDNIYISERIFIYHPYLIYSSFLFLFIW